MRMPLQEFAKTKYSELFFLKIEIKKKKNYAVASTAFTEM